MVIERFPQNQANASHCHLGMISLMRLFQLTSPTLPLGAYAYSQGLETAVHLGWVNSADSAKSWCAGLLSYSHTYWDVPIFIRLHASWRLRDREAILYWSELLLSGRETTELQNEERSMGRALQRVLDHLQLTQEWANLAPSHPPLMTLFSAAATHFEIDARSACAAYLWAWAESQVMAATKLVPLGQNAAQKILFELATDIDSAIQRGAHLTDAELGTCTPGLAIASALHETQYSRLFRS